VNAVVVACGIVDGHGVIGDQEGDVYELSVLVPNDDDRDRVMDIARQVMEHRQFKAVRDALRTKLHFRDVLYGDEIERIARSTTGLPSAEPPSNGSPRTDVATSVGVRSPSTQCGEGRERGMGPLRPPQGSSNHRRWSRRPSRRWCYASGQRDELR
jgi:hypothetical protein